MALSMQTNGNMQSTGSQPSTRSIVNIPDGISPGARKCLKLLLFYTRRFRRVHPSQKKLAERLNVSDRQVRIYLAELGRLGLLTVHQGGGGRSATYVLNSGLSSGMLPGCFQAKKAHESGDLAGDQWVTDPNFRAEERQSKNPSISCRDQSEWKGIGATPRPNLSFEYAQGSIEPGEPENSTTRSQNEWRGAQRAAVAKEIESANFEATPELLSKLSRIARHHGVNGFVVAAHIKRALGRVANQPSSHPRGDSWFLAVVENALALRSATRRNEN